MSVVSRQVVDLVVTRWRTAERWTVVDLPGISIFRTSFSEFPKSPVLADETKDQNT